MTKIQNEWIKHTLKVWTTITKKLRGPLRAVPMMGNNILAQWEQRVGE